MFYSVTNSSWRFNDINTLFGQSNLKAFVMLNCEELEFSQMGVSIFQCLAMGIKVVVTQPYNVRSAPDFTCSIRIQA